MRNMHAENVSIMIERHIISRILLGSVHKARGTIRQRVHSTEHFVASIMYGWCARARTLVPSPPNNTERSTSRFNSAEDNIISRGVDDSDANDDQTDGKIYIACDFSRKKSKRKGKSDGRREGNSKNKKNKWKNMKTSHIDENHIKYELGHAFACMQSVSRKQRSLSMPTEYMNNIYFPQITGLCAECIEIFIFISLSLSLSAPERTIRRCKALIFLIWSIFGSWEASCVLAVLRFAMQFARKLRPFIALVFRHRMFWRKTNNRVSRKLNYEENYFYGFRRSSNRTRWGQAGAGAVA